MDIVISDIWQWLKDNLTMGGAVSVLIVGWLISLLFKRILLKKSVGGEKERNVYKNKGAQSAPIVQGNSAGGNHAAAVVRKKQEQIKQKNADLIKCYNEQLLYVKVKIKSRLAGAICAPGAKIYLSTEEALQLEKKGIVEIMPLRVYAVQIIKSFTNYPTRYQVGQLMPLNENTANKWIKQGVAKIVFSVEDLL